MFCCYTGRHTFALSSFVYRPPAYLVVDDQQQAYWYEFKVIHQLGITHQNMNTMSQRPFITFEDFLEAMQDFNQILTIHVSYASSYLALL
jgi:hypothetical protein